MAEKYPKNMIVMEFNIKSVNRGIMVTSSTEEDFNLFLASDNIETIIKILDAAIPQYLIQYELEVEKYAYALNLTPNRKNNERSIKAIYSVK